MPYTPKGWLNFPTKTTPINAIALKALEQRVASYAASESVAVGVDAHLSFLVKQRVAGANMSVDVGSASTLMQAWIRDVAGGVDRYEYNGGQINVAIATADGTNPRIDRIVATAPTSVDSIVPQILVLTGTPTPGATTANLSGAQAVPAGYLLLADVVVGAAVVTIVTANITDRRQIGGQFGDSSILPFNAPTTGSPIRDEVVLLPHLSLPSAPGTLTPATHDNFQGAYLGFLSRRIVNATRIRFRFAQGATPAVTNFNVAMLDASGRLIIASGILAFSGGANALVEQSCTITATTFESGPLIAWMGIAPLTAASAVSFSGVQGNVTVTAPGPGQRNVKWHSATGSTTFPVLNRIDAYTDVVAAIVASSFLAMPIFSLSVG